MQDIFLQYGIWGAIIFALGGYILKIEARHKKEREEWLQAITKLFDRSDLRNEKTEESLKENSNILVGLKTLFEVHFMGKKI